MASSSQHPIPHAEAGNAFVLVLIAIALFAALAYTVVYQGGGGGRAQEQHLLSAAQLTQYPAALRTTVMRMIAAGIDGAELTFDPADTSVAGVFSSQGGSAFVQDPPASVGSDSQWRYKTTPRDGSGITGWFIAGIGNDGPRGKDIFAYLEGLSLPVCEQILRGLGLSEEPRVETVPVDFSGADEGTIHQQGGAPAGASVNNAPPGTVFRAWQLAGSPQAYACVRNGAAGEYVYYHVLLEQ